MAEEDAAKAKSWEAIAAAADALIVDGELQLPDEVLDQLFEDRERFRMYPKPVKVGGLEIGWRSWSTGGERPEMQPQLFVDGGEGFQTAKAYKFWKQPRVNQELRKVLSKAGAAAHIHREAEAREIAQADRCDEAATVVFEQADELTAALARRDQIEAALRDAASGKDRPADGDVVLDGTTAEPVAEPVRAARPVPEPVRDPEPVAAPEPVAEADEVGFGEIDLDGLADFAGMVMSSLEQEVAAEMAELFGDVDFSTFA